MRLPNELGPEGERGSVVLGWLTRLTVTLALLGLIGFEVLSVVVVKVQVEDIGRSAAHEALVNYKATRDPNMAYQAASASAEGQGAQIKRKTFQISDESVTFQLEKVAPTLFMYRWDKTAGFAVVQTTVYAEPPTTGGPLP
jgi:hypothetical protein